MYEVLALYICDLNIELRNNHIKYNQVTEQEIIRRQSLQELRNLGIDPYPAAEYVTDTHIKEILDRFEDFEGKSVSIAGRIMSRRIMGNASFAELKDASGRMQIYINRDVVCPDEDKTLYNTVFKKLLDIGDIIGIKGEVHKTKMGEISVFINAFTILTKSLRP